jgi:hypothetical protein
MSVFFAHAKATPNEVIDDWAARVSARWQAAVTAGRDDYLTRSRALGGWQTWVRDVPVAETWDGSPLFQVIVVPVAHLDMPTVGSATEVLLRGFIAAGKPAYAWNHETDEVAEIVDVAGTNSDSWQDTGMLIFNT